MTALPKMLILMPMPGEAVEHRCVVTGRTQRGSVLGYARSSGIKLDARGRVKDRRALSDQPTSDRDLLYCNFGSFDAGYVPTDEFTGLGQLTLLEVA